MRCSQNGGVLSYRRYDTGGPMLEMGEATHTFHHLSDKELVIYYVEVIWQYSSLSLRLRVQSTCCYLALTEIDHPIEKYIRCCSYFLEFFEVSPDERKKIIQYPQAIFSGTAPLSEFFCTRTVFIEVVWEASGRR